jgi:leucyl/phenylalanyl-tRNA---protein transferase
MNPSRRRSRDVMRLTAQSPLTFPDARMADAEGLVAVGGDLSVERLLAAYRSGIFPWTVHPVSWWSPDPRGIFELDQFHVARSLAKTIRREVFQVTMDQDFKGVMEGCAEPGAGRRETWIKPEFIRAYAQLHQRGHAHSVECWHNGELAGGIYGVVSGGLFAGESMFHRVTDASKVALHHLVGHLRARNFALFDIQMVTPITRQLGAVEISRAQYLKRLAEALKRPCVF